MKGSISAWLRIDFLFLSPGCVLEEQKEHPHPQANETYTDYLSRTEQYWVKLARQNMGPEAKEKKTMKVGHAMAKAFYETST